jgi:hypothetical protein
MKAKQCVIDGEDDTKDDILISEKKAARLVAEGKLVECKGCSMKGKRAFHTKKSFPELFKQ